MIRPRILSIDYGDRRVGFAVSDPLWITAQGLETLDLKRDPNVYARVVALCKQYEVGECVVGLPLHMNGDLGDRAKKVVEWVEGLRTKIECPVVTWDERLTSREAQRLMIAQDLSRKKQKEKSDQLSAILILQNYLDYKKSTS